MQASSPSSGANPLWLWEPGYRGLVTTGAWLLDYIRPHTTDPSARLAHLSARTQRITSSDLVNFLQVLLSKVSFNYTLSFLFLNFETFTNEKITAILQELRHESATYIIPVNVRDTRYGIFSMNHVVTILVKNGTVYYFDPLGMSAKSRLLHPLLELCGALLVNGPFSIQESRQLIQRDFVNCGIYAMRYMHAALITQLSLEKFITEIIPAETVTEMRQFIIGFSGSKPANEEPIVELEPIIEEIEEIEENE